MIYFFENKCNLMLGTEQLEEVRTLTNLYTNKSQPNLQDILDYIYFAYHKQSPLANLLPKERKIEAIKSYSLFKKVEKNDNYFLVVESLEGVMPFIDKFLTYQFNELEKQKIVYLEKIEKYTNVLMDINSNFEVEQEAAKALDLFNKQIEKLNSLIAKMENKKEQDAYKHLFEIPEIHLQALKESGYSLN